MARPKNMKDIDDRIKRLRREMSDALNQKKEFINKKKGLVGELMLTAYPDIPTDKQTCKAFVDQLVLLIHEHQDEFNRMLQGAGVPVPEPVPEVSVEEVSAAETAEEPDMPGEEEGAGVEDDQAGLL